MNTSSSIAFYPNESRATFPWTRTSEEEIEEIEDDDDEDEDDNVDEEEEEELEEEPRILRKKKAKNEIEEEEKNEKEGTPLSPVNHITSSSSILVPSYESNENHYVTRFLLNVNFTSKH
ncbi:hypothetical protein HMI54_010164 [Coelomomyces lativittatus]|nr:hypothetical protein HMI54_010164 [Coelomomyces lativittatus]